MAMLSDEKIMFFLRVSMPTDAKRMTKTKMITSDVHPPVAVQ